MRNIYVVKFLLVLVTISEITSMSHFALFSCFVEMQMFAFNVTIPKKSGINLRQTFNFYYQFGNSSAWTEFKECSYNSKTIYCYPGWKVSSLHSTNDLILSNDNEFWNREPINFMLQIVSVSSNGTKKTNITNFRNTRGSNKIKNWEAIIDGYDCFQQHGVDELVAYPDFNTIYIDWKLPKSEHLYMKPKEVNFHITGSSEERHFDLDVVKVCNRSESSVCGYTVESLHDCNVYDICLQVSYINGKHFKQCRRDIKTFCKTPKVQLKEILIIVLSVIIFVIVLLEVIYCIYVRNESPYQSMTKRWLLKHAFCNFCRNLKPETPSWVKNRPLPPVPSESQVIEPSRDSDSEAPSSDVDSFVPAIFISTMEKYHSDNE